MGDIKWRSSIYRFYRAKGEETCTNFDYLLI